MPAAADERRLDLGLDELASLVREAYGFTDIAIGERLQGGYANDLFHVTADGGESVLRVKYPPVRADDIAWEHRLQHELARRLDEVQAPLVAVDGSTYVTIEQRIAWLLPFVAGETADPEREPHRLAAARALGRVHRTGSDLGIEPRPRQTPVRALPWPPLTVTPELEAWEPEIADARAWAVSFVQALHETRPLATSLVHGDFFPGNVLVTSDRVVRRDRLGGSPVRLGQLGPGGRARQLLRHRRRARWRRRRPLRRRVPGGRRNCGPR